MTAATCGWHNFRVRSDYFQNWRLRVDVYYVDPNDHTMYSTRQPTSG